MDYLVRFVAGGVVVSLFAMIGDVLRPKSFAGLFGAAPSVAFATLTLAFCTHGGMYVSIEGRSMILGVLAQPAGTEDADMRKEKLFPVGGGVGLTHFRVVMPGVLYRGGTEGPRAGGDGPRRPLQNQSLQALCKAGFSQAVYAYRTGWNGTENVSCVGNSLQYDYHQWDNRAALKQVFIKLHEIITQGQGAMYVHCWYGLHASGFISATALAQFCGWDSRRAAEYWDSVIPPKIRYPKEHDEVANFVRFTDPELQISMQDATRVCPP